ncbi:hypothetical protein [Bacillus tropicus]|uniref:hypothetical protein n=1 Tax=Bacillus tropicus TaxID=2026188 RepID=UPI003D1C6C2E
MPNGSFSYESVAYIQFLCLELQNVIEKSPTNNQFPVQQSQIPLMLQQLYNTLETFIQELIIEDLTEYNQLLNYITNEIDIISVQPVTAAVGIPPEQPQIFINFFTALQTTTADFFTNQNLQKVLNPLYIFFRDFQVQGYTQYAKFLTIQILQSLNQTPLCVGKTSQLLQQICAEMADLIKRLIIDESTYEQLVTLLAQIASNSTVCSNHGATGHTGTYRTYRAINSWCCCNIISIKSNGSITYGYTTTRICND